MRIRKNVFVPLVVCFSLNAADSSGSQITRLNLKDAISLALTPGLAKSLSSAEMGVEVANRKVSSAKGATEGEVQFVTDARSLRVDLRALGLNIPRYPLTNPVQFVVANGPYGVLDPRIEALKTLIDTSAKRNVKVARSGVQEAALSVQEQIERVAAETAREYFEVVRTSQIFELGKWSVSLAELTQRFAEQRNIQRLASASVVRQSEINTNSERQKLSSARLEQRRAVLRLMYLIGFGLGETLEVSDTFEERPPGKNLDEAIRDALRGNGQLATLLAHDRTLELEDAAIRAERLPVLAALGDVGLSVVVPDPSSSSIASRSLTYQATLEMRIPIFDGHRRSIEQTAVTSERHQQENLERDLRRQIELDIRLAFAALQGANEQLDLAKKNLKAAELDFVEAKANHATGNISAIELQQSETSLAAARDYKDAALYSQLQVRLSIAEVSGNVSSLDW